MASTKGINMNKSFYILSIVSLLLFFNCGIMQEKSKSHTSELIGLLVANNSTSTLNVNCSKTNLSGITSKLSQVTNPSRTQYKVSGCGVTDFSSIGFTATEITSGATGASSTSLLASNSDISISTTKGGTNIEVTFKLNGGTGSLDVIVYGAGTTSTISGPTFRLSAGNIPQFKTSDGMYMNVSKGSAVVTSTLAADTSYTYCLDFQYTSMGMSYMNGWEKACSDVASTDRGSMMYYPIMVMMNVPSYTAGSKVGFILNHATVNSFTVGNIISEFE